MTSGQNKSQKSGRGDEKRIFGGERDRTKKRKAAGRLFQFRSRKTVGK